MSESEIDLQSIGPVDNAFMNEINQQIDEEEHERLLAKRSTNDYDLMSIRKADDKLYAGIHKLVAKFLSNKNAPKGLGAFDLRSAAH